MAALPPPWDLFMTTVEGRESITSAGLVDGLPAFNAAPIRPGAPPNLVMLAVCLRSDQPIPDQVRLWLADLVDPAGASTMQLVRRRPGQRTRALGRHWEAVARFDELVETMSQQQALHQVGQEFGISRATIQGARAEHKSASEAE